MSSDADELEWFWAHETELLEPGTCLFSTANQDWGESMEHRNKAVILIVKASKTDYSGIILNRCTGKTVQELHSLQARVGKEFRKNQVFFGGDYSLGAVDIVHGIPPQRCPGAEELVPGLYRGGFNASRELVQDSIVEPASFRIFLGYTHWKADELHKEVRRKGLLHKTGQRDIWYDVLSLVGLPTITTQQ